MSRDLELKLIIGAEAGKYFKTLSSARRNAEQLGKEWKSTNKKLSAVKDLQKYKTKLNELKQKQKELGHSNKALDAGIANYTMRYRQAKTAVKGYGIAVLDAANAQAKLVRQQEKQEKLLKRHARMGDAAAKFQKQRMKMLGAAAGMYAFGRMANSAMQTEEQGLYLRTVINARDGDKDAAVGRSMAHARKFSKNSLASDKEVLDIEYNLNSGGLSEDVSRSGSELVHKLAKVTRGVPGQVGKIFATTFNNLGGAMAGTEDEKMGRIADVLAKTQFKFQLENFDQLGQSMAFASATVASAKVNFEQSAAALGVLNGAGLEGSRAGTGFNAMMRNMTKAGDELGFGMVRGADGTLDLIATLEGLQGSLDGMDIDERGDLLQKLFGDEGKAAIVPLIDQLDNLKDGTDALENSAGTVSKSYDRFLKSSGGQAKMFGQNLKMIGDVFAGTLLPAINAVLTPVAKFMGLVAFAIEKFPALGWVLGSLGTVFAALAVKQLVVTAAQWAWNAAVLAFPGTWILGIAVVIGAAIIGIAANWDSVKEKLGQVWAAFKKFAVNIGKLFMNFSPLGLMIKQIKWVSGALGKLFGGKKAIAAVTATATIAASPLPAMPDLPAPASAGQMVNQDNSQTKIDAPITINQLPGENAEDVAMAVNRALDQRDRDAKAKDRRMLHDG